MSVHYKSKNPSKFKLTIYKCVDIYTGIVYQTKERGKSIIQCWRLVLLSISHMLKNHSKPLFTNPTNIQVTNCRPII